MMEKTGLGILPRGKVMGWLDKPARKRVRKTTYIAFGDSDFCALFIKVEEKKDSWEGHWFCSNKYSAFKVRRMCLDALALIKEKEGAKTIIGITSFFNKSALRLAKSMGFQALKIVKDFNNKFCILSIKEI